MKRSWLRLLNPAIIGAYMALLIGIAIQTFCARATGANANLDWLFEN